MNIYLTSVNPQEAGPKSVAGKMFGLIRACAFAWEAFCETEELLLSGLSMCLAEGLDEPGLRDICLGSWARKGHLSLTSVTGKQVE